MSEDLASPTPEASAEGETRPISAAMALLAEAEVAAGTTRSQAERYAHQREAEADLLVQKARRLLIAAEGKAEVIVATARARAGSGDQVIDLDELTRDGSHTADSRRPGAASSELDKMLESAIARAVIEAFPADTSA